MDQMACSVGGLIHIDFKNPEEPVVEKVPSDFEAYKIQPVHCRYKRIP